MARADLATTAVKHGASSVIAVACGHCGILPVAAVSEATHWSVSAADGERCCGGTSDGSMQLLGAHPQPCADHHEAV
jgi:hypothetical protein